MDIEIVSPRRDRLEMFSKYLQQLVTESLGKRFDVSGRPVNQGLSVYENKGLTDQHAYAQELRDGLENFFCVFTQVQKDRCDTEREVKPNITSGDFLTDFLFGTWDTILTHQPMIAQFGL
jgi:glucose-6-phosphate isomerase